MEAIKGKTKTLIVIGILIAVSIALVLSVINLHLFPDREKSTTPENQTSVPPLKNDASFDIQDADVSKITHINSTRVTNQDLHTPQTPTPPTCPSPVNPSPWIHLEPVADHSVGENFSLKGTTNLNSGEKLSIFVYQSPPSPNKKLPSEYTDVRGVALVSAGECGINVWSFSENLTTLRPSLYTTQVRAANNATIEANLVQFYIVGDRIVAS